MTEIRCRVSEVVVFRFGARAPEYLLLRRADNDPVYPGTWQIVTGTIDEGETAMAAARREVIEETGLFVERFWSVPHSSVFYSARRDEMQMTAFFAVQSPPAGEAVLSAEHSLCEWLPFVEAQERLVWPGQKEGMRIVHDFIVRGEQVMTLSRLD